MIRLTLSCALVCLLAAGCSSYSWTARVPADARTLAVPSFRNESDVTGFGDVVARQVLREVQREGTFAVRPREEAAVELQGSVSVRPTPAVAYNRRTGLRDRERRFSAVATVSVVDRRSGRVLADSRCYEAETTFLSQDDVATGRRDAAGRVGEALARQIVDDLAAWEFGSPE